MEKRRSFYTDEQLLSNVCADDTSTTYDARAKEQGLPSVSMLLRRWGSWRGVIAAKTGVSSIGHTKPNGAVTVWQVNIPDCGMTTLVLLPVGCTKIDVLKYVLETLGIIEIEQLHSGEYQVECKV